MNSKKAKRLRAAMRKGGLDAGQFAVNGTVLKSRSFYQKAKDLPADKLSKLVTKMEGACLVGS
jgi:hypothetical protein